MESEKDKKRRQFEEYSFDVVDKLSDECNWDMSQLTQDEREVVRLWRLVMDMNNGGFLQFFCNWGYENFIETQKALKRIKATYSLSIITECENIISVIKDDERLKSYGDIYNLLPEYLTEEQENRLDELDQLFWSDPDDLSYLGYINYIKFGL